MQTDSEPPGTHFYTWSEGYEGLLYDDQVDRFRSLIYGWDTRERSAATQAFIPEYGAVWGFLSRGSARVTSVDGTTREIHEAEYFVTANGAQLTIQTGSQLLAVQQIGFLAIPQVGGPIEGYGRLRYIDGCSDSVLVMPPVAGDPCLNHLHFPPGIDQTQHTHPSMRAGIVARGWGCCTTPSGVFPLQQGQVFVIPADCVHGFQTSTQVMDVIAYHPDSDHGPRHEDHPMVNRTLVGGGKIDNSHGVHAKAEIVDGRFAVELEPDSTTALPFSRRSVRK